MRRATHHFSGVRLLDGNVAERCRAGHYSLGCHWSAVQQRLFAGSSVFGPYVQQLQSQFRWVWTHTELWTRYKAPYDVCDRCVVILSVPQDFSYLPEKSVIRSVTTFLTEAGKKGFCPSVTFVSHGPMSPFHFLSFLWLQVQTLSTRSWLKPLWPLLRRSGLVSNSHPSTGAFLSLLWWGWVMVRLCTVVLVFKGFGPTDGCSECLFCWQERMFSISVWCWQHLKLPLLRVLLSFWAPGCHHHLFTA